ncbi:MAG: ABC transporter ATP-binding protein [Deltaproteobacteria bacterium]|nr:ABC transporter ATP-binding protein [Deltaproteobacteria bacterium]
MERDRDTSGGPSAVALKGVTKEFRSGHSWIRVLDRLDLTVARGEFAAVRGPSGSGKSTLLALIAGLERPTSGEVLLFGEAIQGLSEGALARIRRDRVGFVFQSFQLLGNLTARENVQLPLEIAEHPSPRRRADELLAAVGLADRFHHYPSQLSGGEQQRVAVARAFVGEPALLLADEPTGNLDAASGAVILELLTSLRERFGTTLVLVTHSDAVAARADRCVTLRAGRVDRDEAAP